ncbi:hypothetical protein CCACVL1_17305, partial [Corchorus capsularis]
DSDQVVEVTAPPMMMGFRVVMMLSERNESQVVKGLSEKEPVVAERG